MDIIILLALLALLIGAVLGKIAILTALVIGVVLAVVWYLLLSGGALLRGRQR